MKLNFSSKGKARKAADRSDLAAGRGKLARARSQISQAVGGVLTTLTNTERAAGAHTDRLREVLSRDRALAAVRPSAPLEPAAVPAPSRPAAAASEERPQVVQHEPIRTRTMARLLAAQGYRQRALAIYTELLTNAGADAALRAEADALRSRSAPA
jgi:hypothetical protein